MDIGLANLGMLLGLATLAIPLLLHLLKRRRQQVVDWGAMQFLPASTTMRRRRRFDEFLLMLLRMGVLAALVLAMAAPFAISAWLAPLADGPARDVVLVVDGSYSMDVRVGAEPTPATRAQAWAEDFVAHLGRRDRVAVVVARQPPTWPVTDLTADRDRLTTALTSLPEARGNPDLPAAVAAAWQKLMAPSQARQRQIVVLTDGQQYGATDAATAARWDELAQRWRSDVAAKSAIGEALPSLTIVDVASPLPAALPNFALTELKSGRGMVHVGQKVAFRSALLREGMEGPARPRRIHVELDGREVLELPVADTTGQAPLSFELRFDEAGTHLVSLIVTADDALRADNAQHAVVEVVRELPVLLVDGDRQVGPESSAFFLQRALAPSAESKEPRVVPAEALRPADFEGRSVVVLADVPRLSPLVLEALERHFADGGGVLMFVGERVEREKDFYNEKLYREGRGWLPARLVDVAKGAAQLEPKSFAHPALELFSERGALGRLTLPRWWRLRWEPGDRVAAMAYLSSGDALLVEKRWQRGRVILVAAPPDRRWESPLPTSWEFPVLVNELVADLAGNRADACRLTSGRAITVTSGDRHTLTLQTPDHPVQTQAVESWPWVFADTGAIGVYRVSSPATVYYVVPPDLRESSLERGDEASWRRVAERMPVPVHIGAAGSDEVLSIARPRVDVWWLVLLAVMALLCGEVWMTRRMARA